MRKYFQQIVLKRKYKKAKDIYIVVKWIKWGILTAKYSGKVTKEGQPLTIHFTDCNGTQELYFIAPWYQETTGAVLCYFFNKEQAEIIANKMNLLEERYIK